MAGRKYSNQSSGMLDPKSVKPGNYSYLRDPVGEDSSARDALRKAESEVKTNKLHRELFGGSKTKRGMASAGRTDAQMKEGHAKVSRARRQVDKVQTYRQAIGKKP